jgi:hypothetical protein
MRTRVSGGQLPEAFGLELLTIIEIDTDNRISSGIQFDLDDIDAAFAELDARYLAGEAAAHAHTWSVVAGAYASLNRQEIPPTTQEWVNLDHRRVTAFAPGDQIPYLRATWDIAPEFGIHIESVHRLTDLGAVVTNTVRGTTREGFEAEWREIATMTVEGYRFSRSELFDETDLDAALATFDELNRPAPWLGNAASRVFDRLKEYFAARDWPAMAEMVADDMIDDDRRRVVNAGRRQGRDALIAEVSSLVEVGVTSVTSDVIATRGGHLVLSRVRLSDGSDHESESFLAEVLTLVEIDTDGRLLGRVVLDVDDIGAAFEELDARYLAGEASDHSQTWSVIADTYAAFNRHGLVPDWVGVDHRRGSPFASSDLNATIRAARDLTPDLTIQIESVHRLSAFGAVVTNMSSGSSDEGFAAEWRMVQLLIVDGGRIARLEIFDETDLDAALARFDELNRPAP